MNIYDQNTFCQMKRTPLRLKIHVWPNETTWRWKQWNTTLRRRVGKKRKSAINMIPPKTVLRQTVLNARSQLVIQCLASSLSTCMLCGTSLPNGHSRPRYPYGPKKRGPTISCFQFSRLYFYFDVSNKQSYSNVAWNNQFTSWDVRASTLWQCKRWRQ